MNSPLLTFVVLVLIAIVLIGSYVLPRKRGKSELNRVAIYEEQCPGSQRLGLAIRYGSGTSNWRIALYEDMFALASVTSYTVKYADIASVECKEGLFSSLLHVKSSTPAIDLTLRPKNAQRIVSILLEKKVRVLQQDGQKVRVMKVLRFVTLSFLIAVIGVLVFLTIKVRS